MCPVLLPPNQLLPNPWLPHPAPSQLWHAYLSERRLAVRGLRPDHVLFEALNNVFERALVSMHKMPRVWMDYLALLMEQRLVTRTRRTFDRALAALPITQHDRIWQLYLVGKGKEHGRADARKGLPWGGCAAELRQLGCGVARRSCQPRAVARAGQWPGQALGRMSTLVGFL